MLIQNSRSLQILYIARERSFTSVLGIFHHFYYYAATQLLLKRECISSCVIWHHIFPVTVIEEIPSIHHSPVHTQRCSSSPSTQIYHCNRWLKWSKLQNELCQESFVTILISVTRLPAQPTDGFDDKIGKRWAGAEAGMISPQVKEGEIT